MMRNLSLLFASLLMTLGLSLGVPSVSAAGTPEIKGAILHENYTPVSILDIFGANDEDQNVAVAINEDLSDFTNLTSAANGDLIFGVAQDSTGTFVFLTHGEDENPIGGGWDFEISKVDDSGAVQGGWPVVIDAAGGAGGSYSANGFARMIPGTAGDVWVLYYVGTNDPPGPPDSTRVLQLTHFTSGGTETAGFPVSLGETTGDIMADGSGGVFVVYGMGPDILGGSLYHGSARHYTTAGIDGTWAGGSGTLTLSTDAVTTKRGLTIVSDSAGGAIALWNESTGIYGQRFTSAGVLVAGWATRGNLIYASAGGTGSIFRVRGATSAVGEYYAVFKEYGLIKVMSFDGIGSARWGCTHTLSGSDDYVAIRSIDGSEPGVYVVFEDGEMTAQLFQAATGNSVWQLGGEEISGGSDVDFVFPDQSFIENTSAGAVPSLSGTGFAAVYTNADSGDQEPETTSVIPTTFPAGPGGDCTVASAPDAPTLSLDVVGNGEVDLSLIPGADNGSVHTDFVWEYKEASSGVFLIFADGPGTSTTLTLTGLINGILYDFRAAGVNAIGQGAYSNIVQATPLGSSGQRRDIPTGGAIFYFGSVDRAAASSQSQVTVQNFTSITSTFNLFEEETFEDGSLKGAAEPEPEQKQEENIESRFRAISIEEYIQSNVRTDQTDAVLILDLVVSLQWLMEWYSDTKDYQLFKRYDNLATEFQKLFRTRWFHYVAGVTYIERIRKVSYNFDYLFPIKNETENVLYMMRSMLLTFGRACFSPEVLAYAEEVDYLGNELWYYRYFLIMKPWMDAVLGERGYPFARGTSDIDALRAVFILMHQFCLGGGFETLTVEEPTGIGLG